MLLRRHHKKKNVVGEIEDEVTLIENPDEAHLMAIKEELNKKTVKELIEEAKEKGIEGYSNMKKEELVEVLAGE